MSSSTRAIPGQRVTSRILSRVSRRPSFGARPGFFERFGLEDPWSALGTGWAENSDGLDFVYVSGEHYYAHLKRMIAARQRMLARFEAMGAMSDRFSAWSQRSEAKVRPFHLSNLATQRLVWVESSNAATPDSDERAGRWVTQSEHSRRNSRGERSLFQALRREGASNSLGQLVASVVGSKPMVQLTQAADLSEIRQAVRRLPLSQRRVVENELLSDPRFESNLVALRRDPLRNQRMEGSRSGLRTVLSQSPSFVTLNEERLAPSEQLTRSFSQQRARSATQTLAPIRQIEAPRREASVATVVREARTQQVTGRAGPRGVSEDIAPVERAERAIPTVRIARRARTIASGAAVLPTQPMRSLQSERSLAVVRGTELDALAENAVVTQRVQKRSRAAIRFDNSVAEDPRVVLSVSPVSVTRRHPLLSSGEVISSAAGRVALNAEGVQARHAVSTPASTRRMVDRMVWAASADEQEAPSTAQAPHTVRRSRWVAEIPTAYVRPWQNDAADDSMTKTSSFPHSTRVERSIPGAAKALRPQDTAPLLLGRPLQTPMAMGQSSSIRIQPAPATVERYEQGSRLSTGGKRTTVLPAESVERTEQGSRLSTGGKRTTVLPAESVERTEQGSRLSAGGKRATVLPAESVERTEQKSYPITGVRRAIQRAVALPAEALAVSPVRYIHSNLNNIINGSAVRQQEVPSSLLRPADLERPSAQIPRRFDPPAPLPWVAASTSPVVRRLQPSIASSKSGVELQSSVESLSSILLRASSIMVADARGQLRFSNSPVARMQHVQKQNEEIGSSSPPFRQGVVSTLQATKRESGTSASVEPRFRQRAVSKLLEATKRESGTSASVEPRFRQRAVSKLLEATKRESGTSASVEPRFRQRAVSKLLEATKRESGTSASVEPRFRQRAVSKLLEATKLDGQAIQSSRLDKPVSISREGARTANLIESSTVRRSIGIARTPSAILLRPLQVEDPTSSLPLMPRGSKPVRTAMIAARAQIVADVEPVAISPVRIVDVAGRRLSVEALRQNQAVSIASPVDPQARLRSSVMTSSFMDTVESPPKRKASQRVLAPSKQTVLSREQAAAKENAAPVYSKRALVGVASSVSQISPKMGVISPTWTAAAFARVRAEAYAKSELPRTTGRAEPSVRISDIGGVLRKQWSDHHARTPMRHVSSERFVWALPVEVQGTHQPTARIANQQGTAEGPVNRSVVADILQRVASIVRAEARSAQPSLTTQVGRQVVEAADRTEVKERRVAGHDLSLRKARTSDRLSFITLPVEMDASDKSAPSQRTEGIQPSRAVGVAARQQGFAQGDRVAESSVRVVRDVTGRLIERPSRQEQVEPSIRRIRVVRDVTGRLIERPSRQEQVEPSIRRIRVVRNVTGQLIERPLRQGQDEASIREIRIVRDRSGRFIERPRQEQRTVFEAPVSRASRWLETSDEGRSVEPTSYAMRRSLGGRVGVPARLPTDIVLAREQEPVQPPVRVRSERTAAGRFQAPQRAWMPRPERFGFGEVGVPRSTSRLDPITQTWLSPERPWVAEPAAVEPSRNRSIAASNEARGSTTPLRRTQRAAPKQEWVRMTPIVDEESVRPLRPWRDADIRPRSFANPLQEAQNVDPSLTLESRSFSRTARDPLFSDRFIPVDRAPRSLLGTPERPAWATRMIEGTVLLPHFEPRTSREPFALHTGGSVGVLTALARADRPEEVIQLLIERSGDLRALAAELPGQAGQTISRLMDKGDAARDLIDSRVSAAVSAIPRDPSLLQPHRSVSNARQAGRLASGSTAGPRRNHEEGSTQVMRLANKLMNLIHLAENERKTQTAREQVRLAEDSSSAKAEVSAPVHSGSGSSGNVSIKALQRDVLEAVLQELALNQQRSQEDSNVRTIGW